MGRFGVTRDRLREELGDLVGVRVGLGVGIADVDPIIDVGVHDVPGDINNGAWHMRSQTFEQLAYSALSRFGDPWTRLGPKPFYTVTRDLPGDVVHGIMLEIHRQVHLDRASTSEHEMSSRCFAPAEFPPYAVRDSHVHAAELSLLRDAELLARVEGSFGKAGRSAAEDILYALKAEQRLDPWNRIERASASSLLQLTDLFNKRECAPNDDSYFAQSFIDYLAANLEQVRRIHWRQFERLAAEHYRRKGYRVELGPGGNDDGVDMRLWAQDQDTSGPPLIIVQCKRQKEKVTKTVVKALWADMIAEQAQQGVIVTSSTLLPGAQKTINARGYNIDVADNAAVTDWLRTLRTPGLGITSL